MGRSVIERLGIEDEIIALSDTGMDIESIMRTINDSYDIKLGYSLIDKHIKEYKIFNSNVDKNQRVINLIQVNVGRLLFELNNDVCEDCEAKIKEYLEKTLLN